MATVQVTENTFEATVEQGIVLLDFWASWCGPCQLIKKVRALDMNELRRSLDEQENKGAAPRAARAGGV